MTDLTHENARELKAALMEIDPEVLRATMLLVVQRGLGETDLGVLKTDDRFERFFDGMITVEPERVPLSLDEILVMAAHARDLVTHRDDKRDYQKFIDLLKEGKNKEAVALWGGLDTYSRTAMTDIGDRRKTVQFLIFADENS